MQQFPRPPTTPNSHHQRISHELAGHAGLHRPTHDASRGQVQHHRHIQPAFSRPDIGKVGHPFAVRYIGLNWRSSKPLRETPSASHIRFTGQAPRCFATKPNFTSTPWRRRPRIFQDIALHLELGNLLAQPLYLGLLGLHHALAGKRPQRVCRQLAQPWSNYASQPPMNERYWQLPHPKPPARAVNSSPLRLDLAFATSPNISFSPMSDREMARCSSISAHGLDSSWIEGRTLFTVCLRNKRSFSIPFSSKLAL